MIELAISSVDGFVVRVFDGGGEDRIGQNEGHHDHGENRRLNNSQADRRRHARAFSVVDIHEFQRAIVGSLQDLERRRYQPMSRTSVGVTCVACISGRAPLVPHIC